MHIHIGSIQLSLILKAINVYSLSIKLIHEYQMDEGKRNISLERGHSHILKK